MKTMCLILAMILCCGMVWKKRRLRLKKGQNFNVITFSQTMIIIFLLYLNNVLLDFLLPVLFQNESLFKLEMFRVIFIENIFFKVVLPIFMIYQSKSTLPLLWIDKDCTRKQRFFMTKQDILPRTHKIKQTATTNQPITRTKSDLVGVHVQVPVITEVMEHRYMYVQNICRLINSHWDRSINLLLILIYMSQNHTKHKCVQ